MTQSKKPESKTVNLLAYGETRDAAQADMGARIAGHPLIRQEECTTIGALSRLALDRLPDTPDERGYSVRLHIGQWKGRAWEEGPDDVAQITCTASWGR
jgi:hypothetical protein